MHPLINIAISAARNAGDIIMRYANNLDRVKVREKDKNDLVSEIDVKAEQAIIKTIHKAYPSHSIIAEESGYLKHQDDDYTWIIDPLDGTSNFIHGFPHFAVSIAMQQRNKIEHAVIFDPIRMECFSATRGGGAQLNGKRIRVSAEQRFEKALLGTGFPFRNKGLLDNYLSSFKEIFSQCAGVRRAGSAALDLAYVASSRLDGFWEYALQPWDIAAGCLLIKEAGGLISDINGSENYLKTGSVVAGNTKIFKSLLQLLKPKAEIKNASEQS